MRETASLLHETRLLLTYFPQLLSDGLVFGARSKSRFRAINVISATDVIEPFVDGAVNSRLRAFGGALPKDAQERVNSIVNVANQRSRKHSLESRAHASRMHDVSGHTRSVEPFGEFARK